MKVRLESNSNPAFLKSALAVECDSLIVEEGGYGLLEPNIIDTHSSLYLEEFDVLVLALSIEYLENLPIFKKPYACNMEAEYKNITNVVNHLLDLVKTFRQYRPNIPVCLFSFPYQTNTAYNFLETNSEEMSLNRYIASVNNQLISSVIGLPGTYVFDINHVVISHGYMNVFDHRMGYLAKSPYSNAGVKYIAKELISFIKRIFEPSKKVLILDLDNTLWGGVVGEDGIDEIILSSDGAGKAYQDFQRSIKNLADRGVLLALCSKNNEQDVIDVFEKHPDMLLQWDDFIVKAINWEDKAKNIKAISEQLNVGIDSMVFLDDNPTERMWVRTALPEMDAPDLPIDPSGFVAFLYSLDEFKLMSLTQEDFDKTISYKAELSRNEVKESGITYNDYLDTLELYCTVENTGESDIKRVAQLLAKTNQFNFTGKRYKENEVMTMLHDQDYHVSSLRVKDRFGNYGLVGLVILLKEGDKAIIDTFILSCRVLGKRVEDFLLANLCQYSLKQWGCTVIEGLYKPSNKNNQLKDFYIKNGFDFIADINGTLHYINHDPVIEFPMHIRT